MSSYLISAVVALFFTGLLFRLWLVLRETRRLRERQDSLTHLPNRIALEEVLCGVIDDHKGGGAFALLVVGLDGFRRVNEIYGYHQGDALLVGVAQRLRELAGEQGAAVRMGGDEFAVALTGDLDRVAVERSAAAVLRAIEAAAEDGFHTARVSASIGVSVFPGRIRNAGDAIREADVAMRGVKRQGGGAVRFAGANRRGSPSLAAAGVPGHATEALIRSALDHNGFRLVFQPMVDRTNQIVQMEALVRIHDRFSGVVPPAEFVSTAERTGLIHEMGRWILREACRHAQAWQAAGRWIPVAFNVSATELSSPAFIDFVLQTLRDSGLDGGALVLEVPGLAGSTLTNQARANLLAARKAGIAIATDGVAGEITGADIVKIECAPDDGPWLTVPRPGRRIAVTCIEEFRQLEQARALDCDYFQGYLIAPPLEPDAATQFLMERNPPSEGRQNPLSQSKLELFDTLPG
ncbi:MAG TPA: EAL domain-containing protein, partial [Bryobacteraceae bacterium]|nr:EAL domain-containing protein [Bryobacteraceae bacterium]